MGVLLGGEAPRGIKMGIFKPKSLFLGWVK
jgi:hypothetical protein